MITAFVAGFFAWCTFIAMFGDGPVPLIDALLVTAACAVVNLLKGAVNGRCQCKSRTWHRVPGMGAAPVRVPNGDASFGTRAESARRHSA